jgi:hypothetical protein
MTCLHVAQHALILVLIGQIIYNICFWKNEIVKQWGGLGVRNLLEARACHAAEARAALVFVFLCHFTRMASVGRTPHVAEARAALAFFSLVHADGIDFSFFCGSFCSVFTPLRRFTWDFLRIRFGYRRRTKIMSRNNHCFNIILAKCPCVATIDINYVF